MLYLSTDISMLYLYVYQKSEQTNLPDRNALSEIGEHWIESYYHFFLRNVPKIEEKRILSLSWPPVHPSAHMERLGSHWTDFHEILY